MKAPSFSGRLHRQETGLYFDTQPLPAPQHVDGTSKLVMQEKSNGLPQLLERVHGKKCLKKQIGIATGSPRPGVLTRIGLIDCAPVILRHGIQAGAIG